LRGRQGKSFFIVSMPPRGTQLAGRDGVPVGACISQRSSAMNKDQVEGKRKQIHGEATDIKGDIKGDVGDDIKGKTEKGVGKAQEAYGDLKDRLKDKDDPTRR
jgi:uncharacterized protein YjbJ (UPF0337 family)